MVVHIREEHEKAKAVLDNLRLRDNGGRRSGLDRRSFSYAGHLPERREGTERRIDLDRRCNTEERMPDRRMAGQSIPSKDRRRSVDRRDHVIA